MATKYSTRGWNVFMTDVETKSEITFTSYIRTRTVNMNLSQKDKRERNVLRCVVGLAHSAALGLGARRIWVAWQRTRTLLAAAN